MKQLKKLNKKKLMMQNHQLMNYQRKRKKKIQMRHLNNKNQEKLHLEVKNHLNLKLKLKNLKEVTLEKVQCI